MHIEILHVHKYINVKIYIWIFHFPSSKCNKHHSNKQFAWFSKRHLGFSASQSLWKPGVSQILPHWGATPNWETPSRILPSTGITLQSLYVFSMNVYAQRNKEACINRCSSGCKYNDIYFFRIQDPIQRTDLRSGENGGFRLSLPYWSGGWAPGRKSSTAIHLQAACQCSADAGRIGLVPQCEIGLCSHPYRCR